MSKPLQTAIFLSLLISLIVSAAFAQRPRRRPRQLGRFQRVADHLKEGDAAPDFTLKTLDGTQTITLSDFQGKSPVALVFGSKGNAG